LLRRMYANNHPRNAVPALLGTIAIIISNAGFYKISRRTTFLSGERIHISYLANGIRKKEI